MKKFKYNLENVLQLKRFNEEESRMALGLAISILNDIENRIKDTAVRLHYAATEMIHDTSQMLIWNNYIIRLEMEKEKLLEQAAQAEIIVEEKRTLYMEAFKEMKMMEKNREKKLKEYKREVSLEEMDEVDDVFAAKRHNN